jgi:hypothetical protein
MYAYRQNVPIDRSTYAMIAKRLGPEPFNGLIAHVVIERPEGGLQYLDIWESEDHCARAFDERIHPAVYATFEEIGFRPSGEPSREIIDVIEVRGGVR